MGYSMRKIYLSGFLLLTLFSCKPGLEIPAPDPGILNLTSFVSVGDGYTAGLSDVQIGDSTAFTGWHPEGQRYSFPSLLSDQFSLAGDISFSQPSLPITGSGRLYVESVAEPICEFEESTPVIWMEKGEIDWNTDKNVLIPDNLGMPGLKISDATLPFSQLESPTWSMLGATGLQTYSGLIREPRPQFFSLFMGLEQYVMHALDGQDIPLPTRAEIVENLGEILDRLTEIPGSHGLIANLPDATTFPYFTRIREQFINIENCKGTATPIYITNSDGAISEAVEGDRILLPARPYLGTEYNGDGPFGLVNTNPVPEQWVLDRAELSTIRASVLDYNVIVDSLVNDINITSGYEKVAVVDLYSAFRDLESGIIEDGIVLSTEYLTGGIFSLDGLFLTPRGNAWLANVFIETINQVTTFGASIPPLDITSYQAIRYP